MGRECEVADPQQTSQTGGVGHPNSISTASLVKVQPTSLLPFPQNGRGLATYGPPRTSLENVDISVKSPLPGVVGLTMFEIRNL